MTAEQPVWNFEQQPYPDGSDETDINLRTYMDRIAEDKLAQYRPEWSDEAVIEWDGNFKSDGSLMLICSERDVEIEEFRRVLEASIAYRAQQARISSTASQSRDTPSPGPSGGVR